ncbi:MAG: helix-turn-helix transcriptional regulator [Actinomycetota bacterium]|nr:helix-turn-helix transcriptional regulator [Actinomycetota bacterium]
MTSEVESTSIPRDCPITDALDVVGERWSLLVLRELTLGVRRFSDVRRNLGAPPQILTARLRRLEAEGVITRRRYSEHPPRAEYVLTAKGEALGPVLDALYDWGREHGAR